jgi:hypothetical protein
LVEGIRCSDWKPENVRRVALLEAMEKLYFREAFKLLSDQRWGGSSIG